MRRPKRVIFQRLQRLKRQETIVISVSYDGKGEVVSNAVVPQTVAPVAAVMHIKFGIDKAAMKLQPQLY